MRGLTKEGYTILYDKEVSFEERKSVFICNIKRIGNEAEAMEFVNSIKSRYKDATHNVYAYITNNGISMRYSDDGEPQGTAGPPVLEVLKRERLNDVAVVVTRYFGGILLGAGGLVRAYGASCKQGVDEAKKVKRMDSVIFTLQLDYDKYGKVNNYFQSKNVVIMDSTFLEKVELRVKCLDRDFEGIKGDIIEMMNGNDIISIKDKLLSFVDDEEKLMEV